MNEAKRIATLIAVESAAGDRCLQACDQQRRAPVARRRARARSAGVRHRSSIPKTSKKAPAPSSKSASPPGRDAKAQPVLAALIHRQSDRGIETLPFRANVTAADRRRRCVGKPSTAKSARASLVQIAARRRASGSAAQNRAPSRAPSPTSTGTTITPGWACGPTPDQRQLELARLAPRRIKIEKDETCPRCCARRKTSTVEAIVDRMRRRDARLGVSRTTRCDEDLPQRKADRQHRERVPEPAAERTCAPAR